jgi:hypothetical protein
MLMQAPGAAAPGVAAIDGISDQSLPAWDGSFPASPLAAQLQERLAGPFAGVALARYVLQWDAPAEPSRGADPAGDYRERFEAWLADVRAAGLQPVLALTSYDASRPGSPGEYLASLQAALALAQRRGDPIAYVEPWNEPNNQGRMSAQDAAALANAAHALCAQLRACEVVAGDFEDGAALAPYERSYERSLTFDPRIWGVHPYASIAARSDRGVLRFEQALPRGGGRAQVWFTEAAAFYCRHGRVLGQAAQAAEAAYLRALGRDPALAIAHAFYYGVMFADTQAAPCAAGGGDDSELYAPGDRPRAAAAVLLGPPRGPAGEARTGGPLAAFGPAPGA